MSTSDLLSGSPIEPVPHHALRHPDAGETTLYLVRHGQTAANVDRLLVGSTDVPLDDHGLHQAARIADRLAADGPFDALISSSLTRAVMTARIIGERTHLVPRTEDDLAEINFGLMEGKTFDHFVHEHPELAQKLLDLNDVDICWPGGESRCAFYERVWNRFDRILRDHARHRVIVVAHGGVIGAFLAMVQGRPLSDPTIYDVMNCSLSHLHVTPEHTLLHLRNDVCHLE